MGKRAMGSSLEISPAPFLRGNRADADSSLANREFDRSKLKGFRLKVLLLKEN